MVISLDDRTEVTASIYFEQAQQPIIRSTLPQKAQNLEMALGDYRKSRLPGATSYGRIILADRAYIGDVWCYCINSEAEPNAMLSYCIFKSSLWSQGAATHAVQLFLKEIQPKFKLVTVGAFTYSSNTASLRVLEKNGFRMIDTFSEDGVESSYYLRSFSDSDIISG